MRRESISTLAIGALLFAGCVQAQHFATPAADLPHPLGKVAIPDSNYEIVFGMAEWLPGLRAEQRDHPGVVMVYIVDGEFWYLINGKAGQRYKVADAAQVLERAFPGEGQARSAAAAMAIYIVEKEQPAVTAAGPRSR